MIGLSSDRLEIENYIVLSIFLLCPYESTFTLAKQPFVLQSNSKDGYSFNEPLICIKYRLKN